MEKDPDLIETLMHIADQKTPFVLALIHPETGEDVYLWGGSNATKRGLSLALWELIDESCGVVKRDDDDD